MPLSGGVCVPGFPGVFLAWLVGAWFVCVVSVADADIRNSAQTVFGIIILGVGPVFAGPLLALLGSVFGEDGVVTNFAGMWFTLAAIALITTVLFGLAFRDETQGEIAETETLAGETVGA